MTRQGADLSTGRAPGDTDEERLPNNVGVLVPALQMCFTVSSHTCNVLKAGPHWNIIVPKPLPRHNCYG